MNTETVSLRHAVQLYAPTTDVLYPLEIAARLAGMPRHIVLVCCRRGLVSPHIDPDYGGVSFAAEDIGTLQHIEHLRSACGVNFAGIEIIQQLLTEIQELRALVERE